MVELAEIFRRYGPEYREKYGAHMPSSHLAAMTAIELALSAMGVIGLGSIAFLVLSLAKAALVALFFMHLRDDSKWYGMVFLAPVLLVLVMSLLVVAA